MSPLIDGSNQDSSFVKGVVGKCPVIKISILGLELQNLVDTGSMVSRITEHVFREFIGQLGTKLSKNSFIQLKAANGLDIPYIGYFEIDVQYKETILKQRGFVIVKDSSDESTRKRKEVVPGIAGMSVRMCYLPVIFQLTGI